VLLLSITLTSLLVVRLMLMGFSAPEFSPSDNPASDSPCVWTRAMTFAFLPALNFCLLLCPVSYNQLMLPYLHNAIQYNILLLQSQTHRCESDIHNDMYDSITDNCHTGQYCMGNTATIVTTGGIYRKWINTICTIYAQL